LIDWSGFKVTPAVRNAPFVIEYYAAAGSCVAYCVGSAAIITIIAASGKTNYCNYGNNKFR